jgi:hypothetical protein
MGPAFILYDYYATQLDFSRLPVEKLDLGPAKPPPAAAGDIQQRGQKEFWVLVANFVPQQAKMPEKFLARLDGFANRVESLSAGDAVAVHYVRRQAPEPSPTTAPSADK